MLIQGLSSSETDASGYRLLLNAGSSQRSNSSRPGPNNNNDGPDDGSVPPPYEELQ